MVRPTNEEKNCSICGKPRTRLYAKVGNVKKPFGWYCPFDATIDRGENVIYTIA